jgi:hypothetical protein
MATNLVVTKLVVKAQFGPDILAVASVGAAVVVAVKAIERLSPSPRD